MPGNMQHYVILLGVHKLPQLHEPGLTTQVHAVVVDNYDVTCISLCGVQLPYEVNECYEGCIHSPGLSFQKKFHKEMKPYTYGVEFWIDRIQYI